MVILTKQLAGTNQDDLVFSLLVANGLDGVVVDGDDDGGVDDSVVVLRGDQGCLVVR
jgi:hypothetical protein